jgi:hypothetical protein
MAGTPGERNPRAILFGRFMLPDGSEHPCQVVRLSADGAVFLAGFAAPAGLDIVAYVDEIGRVEAVTGEPVEEGFAVSFRISAPRRERIEARIRALLGSAPDEEEVPQRRHLRHEGTTGASQITLPDGRVYPCEVLDVSISGAAVSIDVIPALQTYVLLGRMRGRVVRYLASGIGIEFSRPPES